MSFTGDRHWESAIIDRHQVKRTVKMRMPKDFCPFTDAYTPRFSKDRETVVIAFLGYQAREGVDTSALRNVLIRESSGAGGPKHWDAARTTDSAGIVTTIYTAYWTDPSVSETWIPAFRKLWTGSERLKGGWGTFIEALTAIPERYEVMDSHFGATDGLGVLADGKSAPVREHGYWGSMRDRIPMSQVSDMKADGEHQALNGSSSVVRVRPQEGCCLIRSYQEWENVSEDELKNYEENIEPVLHEGMKFLSENGQAIGCICNRYLQRIDPVSEANIPRSFGMSFWRDIGALEAWSEKHPTHLRIFGTAIKYYQTFGEAGKLHFGHEVTIIDPERCFFEFADCFTPTGLLTGTMISASSSYRVPEV